MCNRLLHLSRGTFEAQPPHHVIHSEKTSLSRVVGMGSYSPHLQTPLDADLAARLMQQMQASLFAPTSIKQTRTIVQVKFQKDTQNTKISFQGLLVKNYLTHMRGSNACVSMTSSVSPTGRSTPATTF
jgi:hypothetical protein